MVSRGAGSGTTGRIPYPSADTLAPGDVGLAPGGASGSAGAGAGVGGGTGGADIRRGATTSAATMQQSGLQRLMSMRTRDRSRDGDRVKPGRDRAGSVAVATLGHHAEKQKDVNEREQSTQGLKTWWKAFSQRQPPASAATTSVTSTGGSALPHPPAFRKTVATPGKVFGAPLSRVLTFAAMQISTSDPDGSLYVWGEVPIVVGRCGAYLKNMTDIEGIFRVSGSAKRMRDLQAIFDDGPTYGADIDWDTTGFTPHDVATLFRRYLMQMPEPVIPFSFYDHFRNIQTNEALTTDMRIRDYKRLIRKLPKENQFLLLYTLDLLGIFDKASEKNLMNAANLAVIFQPGLLSHPGHEMRPRESALSRDVVELLVNHQEQFVMSMAMKLSRRRHNSASSRAPQRSGSVDSASTYLTVPETSLAQTQVAIPQAIPEDSHPAPLSPTGSIPKRPVAVRADTDFLQPSDSDEEAPPGGYYIVEAKPRTTSPQPPASAPPKTQPSFTVQDLMPQRPARSAKRTRPSLPNLPSSGTPIGDVMDPSDSDDDAPAGGYVVYENKRPTSARPSPISPSPNSANFSRASPARPEPRNSSPSEGATGLLRRKTLPSKRVSDFTARMRRAVRDA